MAAKAHLMPDSMTWKWSNSARFCDAFYQQENQQIYHHFFLLNAEGSPGEVLSTLKLVPRGRLLLNQGRVENALGNGQGIACEINSLLIVVSSPGVHSSLPSDHRCREPYTHSHSCQSRTNH